MNRVCTRSSRGAKPKDTGLGVELWTQNYSTIYPTLVECRGRSFMKQLLAEQTLNNILVDVKIHFKSRLQRFIKGALNYNDSESTAGTFAGQVLVGIWGEVPTDLKSKLQEILPANVERSVAYDLKKNPLNAMLKMRQAMEPVSEEKRKKIKKKYFLLTRTSNVPCHVKFNTEASSLQGEDRSQESRRSQ